MFPYLEEFGFGFWEYHGWQIAVKALFITYTKFCDLALLMTKSDILTTIHNLSHANKILGVNINF